MAPSVAQDELTSGWCRTTLGELLTDIEAGKSPKCEGRAANAEEFGVLKVSALSWGEFDPEENKALFPDYVVPPALTIRAGDLLISRANTVELVGAVVLVHQDFDRLMLSDKSLRLITDDSLVNKSYLLHALRSKAVRKHFEDDATGTSDSMRNLSQGKIRSAPILLPPLNEQHRIAQKIKSLFTRTKKARAALEAIPPLLDKFRQSVLIQAINGRLDGLDTTDEWTEERAIDVCGKVQSGGTPKEGFHAESGIPFLKVYNIVNQEVSFEYRPQFVAENVHHGPLSKSITQPGDVLMNIVGPPLGKVAIVPDDFPEWNINQAITLFRPSERITTQWLYVVLCAGECIADVMHETKGSVGQVNISLSQCRNFKFPVPPIQQQKAIASRVERFLEAAGNLHELTQDNLKKLDQLEQSILAKAFRGELVPQDPNDEPASVLLERIRTERAAQDPKKRGRKAASDLDGGETPKKRGRPKKGAVGTVEELAPALQEIPDLSIGEISRQLVEVERQRAMLEAALKTQTES